jgi:hypothetical protein
MKTLAFQLPTKQAETEITLTQAELLAMMQEWYNEGYRVGFIEARGEREIN